MDAEQKLELLARNQAAHNLGDLEALVVELNQIPVRDIQALLAAHRIMVSEPTAAEQVPLHVQVAYQKVLQWVDGLGDSVIDKDLLAEFVVLDEQDPEADGWEPVSDVQRDLIEESVAIALRAAYPRVIVDMRKAITRKVFVALRENRQLGVSSIASSFKLVPVDEIRYEMQFYDVEGNLLTA